MSPRICRSRSDRMLGGVCAGLASYLNINSVWVRLFFVLLALGDGIGILFYMILWVILPNDDGQSVTADFKSADMSHRLEELGNEIGEAASHPHPNTVKFIGFGLVVVGIFYLLKNLNFVWLQWINRGVLLPVLLIAGGCILLYRSFKKS